MSTNICTVKTEDEEINEVCDKFNQNCIVKISISIGSDHQATVLRDVPKAENPLRHPWL